MGLVKMIGSEIVKIQSKCSKWNMLCFASIYKSSEDYYLYIPQQTQRPDPGSTHFPGLGHPQARLFLISPPIPHLPHPIPAPAILPMPASQGNKMQCVKWASKEYAFLCTVASSRDVHCFCSISFLAMKSQQLLCTFPCLQENSRKHEIMNSL